MKEELKCTKCPGIKTREDFYQRLSIEGTIVQPCIECTRAQNKDLYNKSKRFNPMSSLGGGIGYDKATLIELACKPAQYKPAEKMLSELISQAKVYDLDPNYLIRIIGENSKY